jgi:hypothetical protein
LPMGHRAKLLAAIRALQQTSGQAPGEQQTASPRPIRPAIWLRKSLLRARHSKASASR